MIALLVIAPLVAAILILLLTRRHAQYIAFAGSAASLALLPLVGTGTSSFVWFRVGTLVFRITTAVNALNLMLLYIVAVIGVIVFGYSIGYISVPSQKRRFYIEMLAFEAAMLTFAASGNFILFFIAWEFLSLTSYLLIGFWHERESAARAARKAITIVLIGDVALLAAIGIFWHLYGTLEFGSILSAAPAGNLAYAALALLLIAIFTKSAQFPFSEWLPDAMEGPTPVSAYLHSSTMVKAGVFAAIILFPLFLHYGLLWVLLVFGIITTVLATLNAIKETHVKRVLAYSTVNELGIMLTAIGGGAIVAAIYLFFSQSFYKVLLFFSSGVMMEASGKEDINNISGIRHNRLIYITTLFGVLALAGFVPFSGFFSNVAIGAAFSKNILVYAILGLVSIGTSFFIFRWLYLPMRNAETDIVNIRYDTTPKSMKYAMVAAAALVVIAVLAYGFVSDIAALAYLPYASGMPALPIREMVIETVLVAIGFYVSYRMYLQGKLVINAKRLYRLVYNRLAMNALYAYLAAFAIWLSDGLNLFDIALNDLFDGVASYTARSSIYIRRIVNGQLSTYLLAFIAGFVLIALFLAVI